MHSHPLLWSNGSLTSFCILERRRLCSVLVDGRQGGREGGKEGGKRGKDRGREGGREGSKEEGRIEGRGEVSREGGGRGEGGTGIPDVDNIKRTAYHSTTETCLWRCKNCTKETNDISLHAITFSCSKRKGIIIDLEPKLSTNRGKPGYEGRL